MVNKFSKYLKKTFKCVSFEETPHVDKNTYTELLIKVRSLYYQLHLVLKKIFKYKSCSYK